MIRVYNTLSRKKEEFKPLEPGKVKMYVCGVTVYDQCHLGHARAYIVFDMIRRYLEHKGLEVTYIQNFTDIDDKIINKALQQNSTYSEVAETYMQEYFKDFDQLKIKHANKYPKATEHIGDMIKLIETLITKGHAYEVNGNVFYNVRSFSDYGKLSGRKLEDNEAGSRVDIDSEKEHPMDFALWKKAKHGEPAWSSPWGEGRPGWHIECSAMSMCHLGETYDIHGGGQDLVFPHHENEIAQSEGATGKPYVKYWLHNGFVNINNEKMSKSLGNFFTIRDLLQTYKPEVLRFYILSSQHYRSPINFSDDQLEESAKRLDKLYQAIWNNTGSGKEANLSKDYAAEFNNYMDDDFNAAGAIGILFQLANETNKTNSKTGAELLHKLGGILGLLQENKPSDQATQSLPAEITELIANRAAAKQAKNWAEADKLRDLIQEKGFSIKDTPAGVELTKLN